MVNAELVMDTHGYASFAPYIHGVTKTYKLYPGYRAEFTATVDFFKINNLFLTGVVGNATVISRSDSSVFTLDKIRYTLSPGFRYEFDTWLIRGTFYHESVYSISKAEKLGGAFWQNSIRLGVGSKGSSYLYLHDEYDYERNIVLNSWDAQINAGVLLYGSESIWAAKNHDYRYEAFGLIRYHIGIYHWWAYCADIKQHIWIKSDKSSEHKLSIVINALRKGMVHYLSVYYSFTIYDTYTEDNEDGMGALGFRVIF